MLDRIVEFKDASAEERKTDLCNAGLMVAEAATFFALAGQLDNKNAQGEFYLTDIPQLAKQRWRAVRRGHDRGKRSPGREQPQRIGGGGAADAGAAQDACFTRGRHHDCAGNRVPVA